MSAIQIYRFWFVLVFLKMQSITAILGLGRIRASFRRAMAASSILDSEATFVQQAEDAGLTQPWIDALRNNQLATFAKLSFAVSSPGVVATDEQVTRFLNTMRDGTPATIAELAAFKRLLSRARP